MGYNGIDFNRARMAPRSGIIDPSRMGPPQVAVPGGSMRQAVVQQSGAPQSVAEILSASNPAMASPDLMAAQGSAGRQRQIADMLMQGVQRQDNTSLAGGLSQLGQAFLARGAGKKADKAEAEAQSVQSLLVKQAMQGDQASIAQLLAGDPAAAINYKTQQDRFKVDDGFTRDELNLQGRGVDLQEQGFAYDKMHGDRMFGLSTDQFTEVKRQFDQGFNLDAELGRGNLGVSRTNAETSRMGVNNDAAARQAEAQQQGAGVAPALAGLPPGVQSASVTKELTGLDTSEEAVGKARSAANIARSFMADSEGYGSLGGGPLADIGQAASQKTAQLKGHTARMIPMMRSPGEGEMTDSDAKRYELSVVSINKGRSANEAVVRDLERFEANEVARDKFLREWQAQNGYGSVSQAKLLWQQYADAEPIFDPETGKPRERRTIYDYLGGEAAPQTAAPSGLAAGTIVDGFRFRGGDPNDQNNWQPASGQRVTF
jgi:hypothetical protein